MTLLNLKLFLYLYLRNSNSPTSVGWHIHIEKIAPDKNDTKHARSQSTSVKGLNDTFSMFVDISDRLIWTYLKDV